MDLFLLFSVILMQSTAYKIAFSHIEGGALKSNIHVAAMEDIRPIRLSTLPF